MKIFAVLLSLSLFIFTPTVASAASPEDYISDFKESLPDGLRDSLSDPDQMIEAVGFKVVISEIYSVLKSEGKELLSFLLTLIGLALLLSLGELTDTRLRSTVRAAASVISSVCIFGRLYPLIGAVRDALAKSGELFSGLIPIFTAITVSGGGVSSAAVSSAGMSITLGVIGWFSSDVLVLAVTVMLLLGMLADPAGVTSGLHRTLKGFFSWGIGIICFLLGGTMALQTVIASASDGMFIRTAKFTASSAIPVVGSAVSGALSTLASGLSYAKSVVGGGSLVLMLTVTLSPIIILLAYRLILSVAVNFLTFLDKGGGVRCFSAMLGALDALIAVLSMSTVVYIFEIILFIKSGVAIL